MTPLVIWLFSYQLDDSSSGILVILHEEIGLREHHPI